MSNLLPDRNNDSWLTPLMDFKQNSSSYGISGGIKIAGIIIAYDLILWITGLKFEHPLFQLVSWGIVGFSLYYISIKYRDNYAKGSISYAGALKICLITSVFMAIITGLYALIFFTYIAPEAINEIMALAEKTYIEQGLSEAELDHAINLLQRMTTPTFMAFSTVFSTFIQGLLLALVTSFFVKKDKNPFSDSVVTNE